MKIRTQEVRTIYHIAVSTDDYSAAKTKWAKDEFLHLKYPKAFNSTQVGRISSLDEMKNNVTAHGDRAGLLAEFLGFDGWENAGYFNEKTHTIDMVVYNYGDMINK